MEKWKHHCDNLGCPENSSRNCLVYSIWHKGTEKPDITQCNEYIPPKENKLTN